MSNKNLGTIEKLMDGFNPYRDRIEESRGLVKKWEPTGLLEGLEDEQKSSKSEDKGSKEKEKIFLKSYPSKLNYKKPSILFELAESFNKL